MVGLPEVGLEAGQPQPIDCKSLYELCNLPEPQPPQLRNGPNTHPILQRTHRKLEASPPPAATPPSSGPGPLLTQRHELVIKQGN